MPRTIRTGPVAAAALLAVSLLALLGAAARAAGPEEGALRSIVAERLAGAVGRDLVEIARFRQMRSAPDPGGGGRVAYCSAPHGAGDELGVNGAIRVVERDGHWAPLNAAPEAAGAADPEGPGGTARRLLASIETALDAVPPAEAAFS